MQSEIKFTFVLPCRLRGGRSYDDYYRLKHFLIPSLQKFLITKKEIEILIIIPDNELSFLNPEDLGLEGLNYKLFKESAIIGIENIHLYGWHKQQIIKLAIFSKVKSSNYLTLDSDLILCNPISYEDFFNNNKPIIRWEKFDFHFSWWIKTARFLGFPDNFDPKGNCFGVTPVILNRKIVHELTEYLKFRFKESCWIKILAHYSVPEKWTEYCLYWLYLINNYSIDSIYDLELTKDLLGHSIWKYEDFLNNSGSLGSLFFHSNYHIFCLVQSNITELSLSQLQTEISGYLE